MPDELEGLRLAKDRALVRSAILARPAHEAFSQPRVLRVIDAVETGGDSDVLKVPGERVPVGEEGQGALARNGGGGDVRQERPVSAHARRPGEPRAAS